MQSQCINTTPDYYPNIPMIDQEFDAFELHEDLANALHDAEAAMLANQTLDTQE